MNTSSIPKALQDEFAKITLTGDEAAARKFLADHLKEFPKDAQDKIVTALFVDAVGKAADQVDEKVKLQKEALSVLADIEKAEKTLNDEKKKVALKAGLGI